MLLNESFDLEEATLEESVNPFLLNNVKVCGVKSKNNRIYPISVLTKAQKLYENVAVYVDHNEGNKNRKYANRLGTLKNPIIKETGIFASLQLNPKNQLSESVIWDFQNKSPIGLSHVVEAKTQDNVVTEISKVWSVDLVSEPATTTNLQESEEKQDEILNIKKELTETINKLNELISENSRLISEVNEIKAKKPVSITPSYQPPVKVDIKDWVDNLKRKY